ncbi:4Fe-4S binding protein [Megalodesulfovibrio paquesii]
MKIELPPSRLQRLIQAGFGLATLWIGWQFARFCAWTVAADDVLVSRPAGVEGFLPISALLGLKHLLATGQYDPVHPAGLTILLFALATALFLRKGFCGYVCPVGLVSNLLEKTGTHLGGGRLARGWANAVLRWLKYPGLMFFLLTIGLNMRGPAVQAFLFSEYNLTADARMLLFFQHPSTLALAVLGGLTGLSLLIRNPWCRWLCPYGALLGVLAWLGSWLGAPAISRNAGHCIDCGRCQRACPAAIAVQRKELVRSPECVGCTRCVDACPMPGTLHIQLAGQPVPWKTLGLGTAGLFLAVWLLALGLGGWNNALSPVMLKAQYTRALAGRPTVQDSPAAPRAGQP